MEHENHLFFFHFFKPYSFAVLWFAVWTFSVGLHLWSSFPEDVHRGHLVAATSSWACQTLPLRSFTLEHSSIPAAQFFFPITFQSGGRREPWRWSPWVLELYTVPGIWVYYASITEWWKESNSTYIFKSRYSDADFSFTERLPKVTKWKHGSFRGHFSAERSDSSHETVHLFWAKDVGTFGCPNLLISP